MVTKNAVLRIKEGFHLRPAALFASEMSSFNSEIRLTYNSKTADGKSIIEIMSLAVPCFANVKIECSGKDENEMLKKAIELIENKWILHGTGVSQGSKTGKAYILNGAITVESEKSKLSVETEKVRLKQAVEAFIRETDKQAVALEKDEAEILRAHIAILKDKVLTTKIENELLGGKTAEASVFAAFNAVCKELNGSEKTADIKDMGDGILRILTGRNDEIIEALPSGTVIVASEIAPSQVLRINTENVRAVVTESGSPTSHSAILLRARNIPAVVSAVGASDLINNGDRITVDGFNGTVFPADNETVKRKTNIKKDYPRIDGTKLFFNICDAEEAESVVKLGGNGIGLFRTEFLFMKSKTEPSEDEQFLNYSSVAKAMQGKTVIIRMLDIGSDKRIDYLNNNGLRGIRYTLSNKPLFKRQIRAILRAACFGNIKIMLPFVTAPYEVKRTKAIIEECKNELKQEGVKYASAPLGIMIETPSAVFVSDLLAKEADFFSIGTNDLSATVTVSNRSDNNAEALSPAVLRAIDIAVKNAKAAGIPVGICGEAATDERLKSFGFDWISVSI